MNLSSLKGGHIRDYLGILGSLMEATKGKLGV